MRGPDTGLALSRDQPNEKTSRESNAAGGARKEGDISLTRTMLRNARDAGKNEGGRFEKERGNRSPDLARIDPHTLIKLV